MGKLIGYKRTRPGYFYLRVWRLFVCYWSDKWDGSGVHIGWRLHTPPGSILP
jgi:hypothetical protein